MSGPEWTPGPWLAERRKHQSVVLQPAAKHDGYSNRVAECPQWSPAPHPQPTPDEAFANARLIAAAPTLYAELNEWLFLLDSGQISGNGLHAFADKTRAVLAKARGEAA